MKPQRPFITIASEIDQVRLIQSSAEFIGSLVPPDYLIDGILQRRFLYSLTAQTGSGKTAISILIAAHVSQGRPLGNKEIARGRVLYFAGENPDDIRMRWLAQTQQLGLEPCDFDVGFVPGTFKLSEIAGRINQEVDDSELSMVVIDTSAAYFEGDEENNNIQQVAHARRMRELVKLPGGPAILVNCHPTKNAGDDNLIPRGGGAFLAEVDGNLTARKSGSIVELHWQGKYRGPDFAPIPFQLVSATTDRLRDSKGRLIPTVVAKPLSETERGEAEASSRSDEDDLLIAIANNEGASMCGLATALQWLTKDHKPYKARVQRSIERLKKGKYVAVERSGISLTPKGEKEAKRVKYNADAAGSKYG
jgi:hypothetical protein